MTLTPKYNSISDLQSNYAVVIPTAYGTYICSEGDGHEAGASIAIYSSRFEELGYWTKDEWETAGEGESVIGAALRLACIPDLIQAKEKEIEIQELNNSHCDEYCVEAHASNCSGDCPHHPDHTNECLRDQSPGEYVETIYIVRMVSDIEESGVEFDFPDGAVGDFDVFIRRISSFRAAQLAFALRSEPGYFFLDHFGRPKD